MLWVGWSRIRQVALGGAMLAAMVVGLPGCATDNEFADLKKKLEDIRLRPRGAIDPPPEFKAQPTYTYAAHKLRSPFLPPSEEALLPDTDVQAAAPDLTRPREYLEQFNIEALKMVGTMQRPGGAIEAIIQDGEGQTQRVRVGNYLGKNFGRVVAIEETRVSVAEIVPDGHDGWVERPRTIRLEGE
ncbi:MAG: pilus assembly protein PilP [Pseudomonadota bacterium]